MLKNMLDQILALILCTHLILPIILFLMGKKATLDSIWWVVLIVTYILAWLYISSPREYCTGYCIDIVSIWMVYWKYLLFVQWIFLFLLFLRDPIKTTFTKKSGKHIHKENESVKDIEEIAPEEIGIPEDFSSFKGL